MKLNGMPNLFHIFYFFFALIMIKKGCDQNVKNMMLLFFFNILTISNIIIIDIKKLCKKFYLFCLV